MATLTKQTPTVRISEKSHQTLRQLSQSSGEPMQTVLDKALEEYRRKRFFDECDAAYAEMQRNPEAWAAYQKELALWDNTLMDGLDPTEVWHPDGSVTYVEPKHG